MADQGSGLLYRNASAYVLQYYLIYAYYLSANLVCIFRYSLISRLAVLLKRNTFLVVRDEKSLHIGHMYRPQCWNQPQGTQLLSQGTGLPSSKITE